MTKPNQNARYVYFEQSAEHKYHKNLTQRESNPELQSLTPLHAKRTPQCQFGGWGHSMWTLVHVPSSPLQQKAYVYKTVAIAGFPQRSWFGKLSCHERRPSAPVNILSV